MYVIWRSGLQPRRLLTITHILFSGAATDGSGTACGFHFGRTVYMNKKAPDGAFFDGRLFLRGKTFVREPAAATIEFFQNSIVYDSSFDGKQMIFFPIEINVF